MAVSFFPFLRGLVGAVLAFAIVTYLLTDCLWTAVAQAATCGLVIQIGYFATIVFLVWRTNTRASEDKGNHELPAEETLQARTFQAKTLAPGLTIDEVH